MLETEKQKVSELKENVANANETIINKLEKKRQIKKRYVNACVINTELKAQNDKLLCTIKTLQKQGETVEEEKRELEQKVRLQKYLLDEQERHRKSLELETLSKLKQMTPKYKFIKEKTSELGLDSGKTESSTNAFIEQLCEVLRSFKPKQTVVKQ